jgi:hypothetical protein
MEMGTYCENKGAENRETMFYIMVDEEVMALAMSRWEFFADRSYLSIG